MNETKGKQKLINLGNALQRLAEALQEPESNPLAIDGTIQRFEFVYELFWKTFKSLLEIEGIETNTPKEALQQAYQAKWLSDQSVWLQMMKDRNETSHLYDKTSAEKIYHHIKDYFPELQRTVDFLNRKFL
jgi:nucleotidyltransferase substrate binding protein (TIGR01987 family)